MVRIRLRILSAVALPLALLACGKRDDDRNLDSLDNELVEAGSGNANVSDPAMTAALHDQIMVDPALTQHANADSVRPPAQPYSGGVPPTGIAQPPGRTPGSAGASTSETIKSAPAPSKDCPGCTAARESLTLGALAARQTNRRTSACAGALRYSASWADRLPADVPLYPGARVTEAAGANTRGRLVLYPRHQHRLHRRTSVGRDPAYAGRHARPGWRGLCAVPHAAPRWRHRCRSDRQ
jgi:hypothetical protein